MIKKICNEKFGRVFNMEQILNYESLTKGLSSDIEKLFYSIMCRRWDIVNVQTEKIKLEWQELNKNRYKDTEINIEKCFVKNLQFLKSNKNKIYYEKLCNRFGEHFEKLVADKNCDYDSKDFYKDKSVFDVFFQGNQPVLDVKEFTKQMLPAKQLMKNNATMVLDEVGTGKTVAGIYAIQRIIQNRLKETPQNDIFPSAAILIVCPYTKREDWNNDIRRQLGRNSIIISQSDSGEIIKQKSQNPNKPLIYVMGSAGGKSDDSKSALKQSFKKFRFDRKWDLVIIDECHNCFDNYKDIIADKIMLLTATPIVVSSNNVREFQDYENLMNNILGSTGYWDKKIPYGKNIEPIKNSNPKDEDIFVCNYKEDIFNVDINRKIKFIACDRTKKRQEWFNHLRNKKGFFTAMYADQDDNRLSEKMIENFGDTLNDYSIDNNAKLEKLVQIIEGKSDSDSDDFKGYETKSIIVFCEMQATVDMIYERISYLSNNKIMVGKKYGKFGKIKNITSNSNIVLEKLKSHIRMNKDNRSILVTTGKSGGTGLNLGEFDVVIHYELPYTNNELEQRFGRIERADDLIIKSVNWDKPILIENEMIFLVNKSTGNESDFETNRMLYYAVNKVNIACKYMPIRNTVLFHPNFTERVQHDAKTYFETIKNFSESEDGKRKIQNYIEYKIEEKEINECIVVIKKSLNETYQNIINDEKEIKEKISKILNGVKDNDTIKEHKDKLKAFLNEDEADIIEIDNILDRTLEYYIWLKNTLKFYGVELTVEGDNTHYSNYDFTNEEDISIDLENEYLEENRSSLNEKDFLETITSLKAEITHKSLKLGLLCEKVVERIKSINNDQKANGIFYISNNKFINETVKQFRDRSNA